MQYNKLVSVSGKSGLFEIIAKQGDGVIIRSLEDNSKHFVSSRTNTCASIENTEVYTQAGNIPLVALFHTMTKSKEPLPNEKEVEAIKQYLIKVYPTIDLARIYASDLKKMVKWFVLLQQHNVALPEVKS